MTFTRPPLHLPSGRGWFHLVGIGRTRVTGPERPTPGNAKAVGLHGLGANGDVNFGIAREVLGDRVDFYTIDHPGFGEGPRTTDFRLEQCADAVALFIRDSGLEPPVLVGYSMGGLVALMTAWKYPESVGGLVFLATSDTFWLGKPFRRALEVIAGKSGLPPRTRSSRALSWALRRATPGWLVKGLENGDAVPFAQAARELASCNTAAWRHAHGIPDDWVQEIGRRFEGRVAVGKTAADQLVPWESQRAFAERLGCREFDDPLDPTRAADTWTFRGDFRGLLPLVPDHFFPVLSRRFWKRVKADVERIDRVVHGRPLGDGALRRDTPLTNIETGGNERTRSEGEPAPAGRVDAVRRRRPRGTDVVALGEERRPPGESRQGVDRAMGAVPAKGAVKGRVAQRSQGLGL